jgi:hypothetical protein
LGAAARLRARTPAQEFDRPIAEKYPSRCYPELYKCTIVSAAVQSRHLRAPEAVELARRPADACVAIVNQDVLTLTPPALAL